MFYSDHLNAAWHLVRGKSNAAGVDGITVDMFTGIAAEQLRQMQKQLRREYYQASPAKGFLIPKKSGGHRMIGLSTVRDRIVQRFLLQQIYPDLEAHFSHSCYAYRPGYSIYSAIEQVMERYRQQPAWVVKADIQQFFDHISWPLLLSQLENLAIEPVLLQLIEQQLKAGVVLQGRRYPQNQGVLQGGVLSGALANLYLSDFDRACLTEGIPLVRYGDDCVAVTGSWLQASRALTFMQERLAEHYLSLHPEKSRVFGPSEEFTFLGHRFCQGEVILTEWRQKRGGQGEGEKGGKTSKKPSYSGPPKACSLIKTKRDRRVSLPDTYWSEPMTTLYVTDQGAYLRVRNQQYQVFHERELKCKIPVNRVSHVVLFGTCNVSHGAVSLSLRRRVPILYLASNGRYFGRLETEGHAQIEYLTQQVTCAQDPEFVKRQAASMITAKLHNCRKVLLRMNRKPKKASVIETIDDIAKLMEQVPTADSVESMLGYEGQGAALYFPAYGSLLKGQFDFEKRTRRPPQDPVNSLLSLGYTLLSQHLHSMVEIAGLHTHFGNLHKPLKNRPSLVCDLIEEFRAPIVDSFVAYLVNSNQFTEEDFTPPDARGCVYLQPDALKTFLKHWEKHLNKKIKHPTTGHTVPYRRCFELQVWEYIACLMGEQENYRAMRWEN